MHRENTVKQGGFARRLSPENYRLVCFRFSQALIGRGHDGNTEQVGLKWRPLIKYRLRTLKRRNDHATDT